MDTVFFGDVFTVSAISWLVQLNVISFEVNPINYRLIINKFKSKWQNNNNEWYSYNASENDIPNDYSEYNVELHRMRSSTGFLPDLHIWKGRVCDKNMNFIEWKIFMCSGPGDKCLNHDLVEMVNDCQLAVSQAVGCWNTCNSMFSAWITKQGIESCGIVR